MFRPALNDLREKRAAGREYLAREFRGGFDQRHDFQMIRLPVTGGVSGHVGEHDVDRAAEHLLQFFRRILVEEIELHEGDAGDRLDVEKIDCDDFTFSALRADALGRDLAPAAWRRAQIHDTRAALKKARLVVDFHKLISRARAIAFALRAANIRVVQLTREPLPRRHRTLLRWLEFFLPAIACHVLAQARFFPRAIRPHQLHKYALAQTAVSDAE